MEGVIRKRNDEESGCVAVDILLDGEWVEIAQYCVEEEADDAINNLVLWKVSN